ncbi:unnamed protein product [Arctogadus glacialis]
MLMVAVPGGIREEGRPRPLLYPSSAERKKRQEARDEDEEDAGSLAVQAHRRSLLRYQLHVINVLRAHRFCRASLHHARPSSLNLRAARGVIGAAAVPVVVVVLARVVEVEVEVVLVVFLQRPLLSPAPTPLGYCEVAMQGQDGQTEDGDMGGLMRHTVMVVVVVVVVGIVVVVVRMVVKVVDLEVVVEVVEVEVVVEMVLEVVVVVEVVVVEVVVVVGEDGEGFPTVLPLLTPASPHCPTQESGRGLPMRDDR